MSEPGGRRPRSKNLIKPENGTKKASNVFKKIKSLNLSNTTTTSLSKLVINHKITDIKNVLKTTKKSVTLCGSININLTGKLENVIIKVYADPKYIHNTVYAYSRNIYNEEKPPVVSQYPPQIDLDPNYLKENIVLNVQDNVVFMKMFKNYKTIEQMIKAFPEKRNEFYNEILELYGCLKERDWQLWRTNECTIKHIIWHNGKWIFLSTINEDPYYYPTTSPENEILSDLINLFKSFGMSNDDLKHGFMELIHKNKYCFPFQYYKSAFIEKKFPE